MKLTKGTDKDNYLWGTIKDDFMYGYADNVTPNSVFGSDPMLGILSEDVTVDEKGDENHNAENVNDNTVEWGGGDDDTVFLSVNRAPPEYNPILGSEKGDELHGTEKDDKILGYGGNDKMWGYAGNDILDGGLGADTMYGGEGDDTYYVDNSGDLVIELANEGIDLVYSKINYTLTANVENLILTGRALWGYGNDLDNRLNGNTNNNTLYGYGGNDTLIGGSGADTMVGGQGDDKYYVENANDKVVEWGNGGKDTVYSLINHTLAENVENLVLQKYAISGTGNELDNSLTGNDKDNILKGGSGNDFIYGIDGANTMYGGDGNDHIQSGRGGDIAYGGIGNDRIHGGYGEDILYGGQGDDILTGRWGADILYGGEGDDKLHGSDNDEPTMYGGQGDDTYFVYENIDNNVVELVNEGSDLVLSHTDYTLPPNVERLYLKQAAIKGCGNDTDNTIFGNSNDNILDGNGGIDILHGFDGIDKLCGGHGNDLIYGDNGADKLYGERGYDTLFGGSGEDVILGGSGNDYLIGGADADILIGGADEDTFRFYDISESQVSTSLRDTIKDFASGIDKIDLSNIDANIDQAGDQAFTELLTSGSFTQAGQLLFIDGVLYGNVDSNITADFAIRFYNVDQIYLTDVIV